MALFTDGSVASIDDLRSYESSVLDTASIEGIDLRRKLDAAQREIADQLRSFLQRRGASRTDQSLDHIVVTDALVYAHCAHTLAITYRDAYHNQLNDRYRGKWNEYEKLAHKALTTLFEVGVGVTAFPMPKAIAPVVQFCSLAAAGSATYSVAVAWQNASGACGQMSEPTVIDVSAGQGLSVQVPEVPNSATGWHVFVGDSTPQLHKQNVAPLAVGEAWHQSEFPIRRDIPGPRWLTPDRYVQNRRELFRG
jgi:hypothetical protein